MKISIDTELSQVVILENGKERLLPFGCEEAFRYVSAAWLRLGWDIKYVYSFTWMGRPIIQLPEDILRIQEAVYRLKPDVIIETGIAHGGSLVLYASLCKVMGQGRVIGVDLEIRSHNRAAIEAHELYPYITLLEGSSTDPQVVATVKSMVRESDKVLVVLDSNHSKAHVLGELEAYGPLVTSGSYIVATDGIMKDLVGAPRSQPDWGWNNPYEAVKEFVATHPEFSIERPPRVFNEGEVIDDVTYWPLAWLVRK